MTEHYDAEERERDKERARLIAAGELPDNTEIESVLQRSQKVALDVERSGKLTDTGKRIAEDTRTFLAATRDVLTEKNRGEELQKIAEAIKKAGIAAQEAPREVVVDAEIQESQERLQDLLDFLKALVWSPGLRRSLRDLNALILECTAGSETVTGDSAERLFDNAEQEAHIQQVANVEASSDGNAQGYLGLVIDTVASRFLGSQIDQEVFPEHAVDFGQDQEIQPQPEEQIVEDFEENVCEPVNSENEGLQRDTEHTRRDYKIILGNRTFEFLNQKVTPEKMQLIADSAQRLFGDVASDKSLATSFKQLFSFISYLIKSFILRATGKSDNIPEEVRLHQQDVLAQSRILLENLASFHKLDEMQRLVSELINEMKGDSNFSRDFLEMGVFLCDSLERSDDVMQDSWKLEAAQHAESVLNHIMRFRPQFFQFLQELDSFLVDLRDDKALQRFSWASRRLGSDVFYDEQGRLRYKPEALSQMKKILVPMFEQSFGYIALPTISGKDSKMEYELRNVVIRTKGLLPEQIEINNDNHLRFEGVSKPEEETNFGGVASLHIAIRGIKIFAEDTEVWYKRLTFPRMSDRGRLNIDISKGMDIELWLSGDSKEENLFHPDRVECKIHKLVFSGVEFAKHEMLLKMLKPIIQRMARSRAEKEVEDRIMKKLFRLDEMMRERLQQKEGTVPEELEREIMQESVPSEE